MPQKTTNEDSGGPDATQAFDAMDPIMGMSRTVERLSQVRRETEVKMRAMPGNPTSNGHDAGTLMEIVFHFDTYNWLRNNLINVARTDMNAVANGSRPSLGAEERTFVSDALLALCKLLHLTCGEFKRWG